MIFHHTGVQSFFLLGIGDSKGLLHPQGDTIDLNLLDLHQRHPRGLYACDGKTFRNISPQPQEHKPHRGHVIKLVFNYNHVN